jgi:PAS domain S-box-containing protein
MGEVLAPAAPIDEEKRLETLRGLSILDTPPEERFDRLTRLAQRVFDVPIALVTLVDDDRQWFKSKQGLNITETPRNISFCGHALLYREALVVEDTALDPRFSDNPLVTGSHHIRFYAGQPIKAKNGSRLGTLCIMNTKPHQFNQADVAALRDLAAIVESELNLLGTVETKNSLLHQSEERFHTLVTATAQVVWTTNAQGAVVDVPSWREFTGQSREAIKGLGWLSALHPEDRERTAAVWQQAVATRSLYTTEFRIRRHDGDYRHFDARGVPVLEQDGSIREWVGTYTDITELKQQQDEILHLNANLEERVHQRTEELKEKNTQLQATRLTLEEKIEQLALTANFNISILESGNDCLKS